MRSLYPEMPIGEIFMPYARKMMAERYDPSQLQGNAMKTLLRLQSAASVSHAKAEKVVASRLTSNSSNSSNSNKVRRVCGPADGLICY